MNFYPLYDTINHVMPYYSDPKRHYHNFQHVAYLLEQYHNFRSVLGLRSEEEAILYDMILWHDVIYTPGQTGYNEANSASAYNSFARQKQYEGYYYPDKHIEIACTGIHATAHHFKQLSHITYALPIQVLLDLDLIAIATPNYDLFETNQLNLRKEAGQAPGQDHAFLKGILDNLEGCLPFTSFVKVKHTIKGATSTYAVELRRRAEYNLRRYLEG